MTTYAFYVNGEYKTIQADTEEEAMKEARIKKDDANSLPEIESFDDKYPLLSQPLSFVRFFCRNRMSVCQGCSICLQMYEQMTKYQWRALLIDVSYEDIK